MNKQIGSAVDPKLIKRITIPMVMVLSALDSLSKPACGADVIKETGLMSGTVYPLLIKLKGSGLLNSTKEKGDPSELGRPLKTFFTLTKLGRSKGHRIRAKQLNMMGLAKSIL